MNNWYLSFDCATKTFAYILIKINLNELFRNNLEIIQMVKHLKNKLNDSNVQEVTNIITKIDNKTKNVISIICGKCVDLIPNLSNNKIDTVNRVKITSTYIKKEIYPIIENIPKENLKILVEFQMSHNTQSKIVSIVLLSLFSEYEIHLVNPCLKNKIFFTEKGRYCYFIEKYKNNYTANKQHALYNFKDYERIFNQKIDIPDKLKGHIADAFMQIIGYIIHNQTHYNHIHNQNQN